VTPFSAFPNLFLATSVILTEILGTASGSEDNTSKIWDAASGRCLQTLEGYDFCVGSVAFSPDSHLVRAMRPSKSGTHRVLLGTSSPPTLAARIRNENAELCENSAWKNRG
jgi:WD40 repeat protein